MITSTERINMKLDIAGLDIFQLEALLDDLNERLETADDDSGEESDLEEQCFQVEEAINNWED